MTAVRRIDEEVELRLLDGVVEIIVPGQPVPTARARKGKGGKWYTPAPTMEYRDRVERAWRVEGKPHLGAGPLRATISLVFARPAYQLKVDGSPRKGAPAYPPTDVDNLAKGCLDALSQLAYGDDAQVVELRVTKRYAMPGGEEAHTEIELATVT